MGGIGWAFRLLPVRIRPSASVAGRSASTSDVIWARGLPLCRHWLTAIPHCILSSVERAAFGGDGRGCRCVVFWVVLSGDGAVGGKSAMAAAAAGGGATHVAGGGARGEASVTPLPQPLVAVAVARPPTGGGASRVAAFGVAPTARVLVSLPSLAPPYSSPPAVSHDGDARDGATSVAGAVAGAVAAAMAGAVAGAVAAAAATPDAVPQ